MRNRGVTPHVAQRTRSAIDGRTTRHPGYRMSQKIRKRVEEIFGWMKTVGGFRRTRYRGVERTGLAGYFVATVLQPGADGQPAVATGGPGRSVGVTRPWRSRAPNGLTGPRSPRRPAPESSARDPKSVFDLAKTPSLRTQPTTSKPTKPFFRSLLVWPGFWRYLLPRTTV